MAAWSGAGRRECGAARTIPLLAVVAPGPREFSFRSANLTHGRLTAYAADGRELAAFTELTERSDP
ncbi:hypothetical protein RB614_16910 [Phytohabitans sp. ZYX-F-186]|uniref:Uncharacterized protein n=1 Tax=Phytohabitans maris TaxID=3071409 RepID=A0ABU0ZGK4_9ACTN|nr:hypothetical protein [Phytohabitans sp. ZYX-F-186]MDQ7906194.1 hypothetical protein [Phytohabitans sp. ZYX-F-186]